MEVWELKLYFYPFAGGLKTKEEKKKGKDDVVHNHSAHRYYITRMEV